MKIIQLGDKLRHKPTNKVGTYREHLNVGKGYMVKPDDGSRVIVDKYENFEKAMLTGDTT